MNEIKIVKSAIGKLDRREDGTQVLVLPKGFELDAMEVEVASDGEKLVISPHEESATDPTSWAEFLDNLEPVDVEWPDVDEGMLPIDDVDLLK